MEIIIPLYLVPEGGTSFHTGCSVDLGLLSWMVGMRLDNYRDFHLALPTLMALTMSEPVGRFCQLLCLSIRFMHLGNEGTNYKVSLWTYWIHFGVYLCQFSIFFLISMSQVPLQLAVCLSHQEHSGLLAMAQMSQSQSIFQSQGPYSFHCHLRIAT